MSDPKELQSSDHECGMFGRNLQSTVLKYITEKSCISWYNFVLLRFGGNLCDCVTLNGRSCAKQTMCFFRSTFFYAIVWFSCNKSRWSDSYTTEFKGKTFFVFDIVNVFRVNELTEICIGCYLSSTRLRRCSVRCVQAYNAAPNSWRSHC